MLLDFQMPGKNGIQVINELRKFFEATNNDLEIISRDLTI
jgi:CheY-like chemotaxis protein